MNVEWNIDWLKWSETMMINGNIKKCIWHNQRRRDGGGDALKIINKTVMYIGKYIDSAYSSNEGVHILWVMEVMKQKVQFEFNCYWNEGDVEMIANSTDNNGSSKIDFNSDNFTFPKCLPYCCIFTYNVKSFVLHLVQISSLNRRAFRKKLSNWLCNL